MWERWKISTNSGEKVTDTRSKRESQKQQNIAGTLQKQDKIKQKQTNKKQQVAKCTTTKRNMFLFLSSNCCLFLFGKTQIRGVIVTPLFRLSLKITSLSQMRS